MKVGLDSVLQESLTRNWALESPDGTHVRARVRFPRGVSITSINDNKHLLTLTVSQALF